MIRIAVDAMGGDFGPSVTVPASLAFLDTHPDSVVLIVGLGTALSAQQNFAALHLHPRCHVVAASEVVTMDDSIEVALRRKKDRRA